MYADPFARAGDVQQAERYIYTARPEHRLIIAAVDRCPHVPLLLRLWNWRLAQHSSTKTRARVRPHTFLGGGRGSRQTAALSSKQHVLSVGCQVRRAQRRACRAEQHNPRHRVDAQSPATRGAQLRGTRQKGQKQYYTSNGTSDNTHSKTLHSRTEPKQTPHTVAKETSSLGGRFSMQSIGETFLWSHAGHSLQRRSNAGVRHGSPHSCEVVHHVDLLSSARESDS
mmetsp:Transcript_18453/g.37304  ORF Transcript_18453/g.37304 Transcript_18453/m.37304 type:complete len:226 (+) Transcript_18453:727-1404(+)